MAGQGSSSSAVDMSTLEPDGGYQLSVRKTFYAITPEPVGLQRSHSWSSGQTSGNSSSISSGLYRVALCGDDESQDEPVEGKVDPPESIPPVSMAEICPHCGKNHSESIRPSATRRKVLKEKIREIVDMACDADQELAIQSLLRTGGVFACKLLQYEGLVTQSYPKRQEGIVKASVTQVSPPHACPYCLHDHDRIGRPLLSTRKFLKDRVSKLVALPDASERISSVRSFLRNEGGPYACTLASRQLDSAELAQLADCVAAGASDSSSSSRLVPQSPGLLRSGSESFEGMPSNGAHKLSL